MSRVGTLTLLLAFFSVPAVAGVTVESATGDWSKVPQLSQRGYQHLNEKMEAKLYEIASSGRCPSFTLNHDRLDFRISFATQYVADGSLTRIVLPQLSCADAEAVIGGALLEMLQGGDYAPSGKSPNGWYQGALGFTFAGKSALDPAVPSAGHQQQKVAGKTPDPNEIVCEKIEEIGTRLASDRTCMSRAQWAEQKRMNRHYLDREQTERPCAGKGGDSGC